VSEPDTDEDIARAFHMLDPDNTGYISIGNLQKVISELGEEMTHEEIEKMIRVAQSGSKEKKALRKLEVNFEEFKAIMTKTD
jgi:Ca2+-binding EF-hand superfamily protein